MNVLDELLIPDDDTHMNLSGYDEYMEFEIIESHTTRRRKRFRVYRRPVKRILMTNKELRRRKIYRRRNRHKIKRVQRRWRRANRAYMRQAARRKAARFKNARPVFRKQKRYRYQYIKSACMQVGVYPEHSRMVEAWNDAWVHHDTVISSQTVEDIFKTKMLEQEEECMDVFHDSIMKASLAKLPAEAFPWSRKKISKAILSSIKDDFRDTKNLLARSAAGDLTKQLKAYVDLGRDNKRVRDVLLSFRKLDFADDYKPGDIVVVNKSDKPGEYKLYTARVTQATKKKAKIVYNNNQKASVPTYPDSPGIVGKYIGGLTGRGDAGRTRKKEIPTRILHEFVSQGDINKMSEFRKKTAQKLGLKQETDPRLKQKSVGKFERGTRVVVNKGSAEEPRFFAGFVAFTRVVNGKPIAYVEFYNKTEENYQNTQAADGIIAEARIKDDQPTRISETDIIKWVGADILRKLFPWFDIDPTIVDEPPEEEEEVEEETPPEPEPEPEPEEEPEEEEAEEEIEEDEDAEQDREEEAEKVEPSEYTKKIADRIAEEYKQAEEKRAEERRNLPPLSDETKEMMRQRKLRADEEADRDRPIDLNNPNVTRQFRRQERLFRQQMAEQQRRQRRFQEDLERQRHTQVFTPPTRTYVAPDANWDRRFGPKVNQEPRGGTDPKEYPGSGSGKGGGYNRNKGRPTHMSINGFDIFYDGNMEDALRKGDLLEEIGKGNIKVDFPTHDDGTEWTEEEKRHRVQTARKFWKEASEDPDHFLNLQTRTELDTGGHQAPLGNNKMPEHIKPGSPVWVRNPDGSMRRETDAEKEERQAKEKKNPYWGWTTDHETGQGISPDYEKLTQNKTPLGQAVQDAQSQGPVAAPDQDPVDQQLDDIADTQQNVDNKLEKKTQDKLSDAKDAADNSREQTEGDGGNRFVPDGSLIDEGGNAIGNSDDPTKSAEKILEEAEKMRQAVDKDAADGGYAGLAPDVDANPEEDDGPIKWKIPRKKGFDRPMSDKERASFERELKNNPVIKEFDIPDDNKMNPEEEALEKERSELDDPLNDARSGFGGFDTVTIKDELKDDIAYMARSDPEQLVTKIRQLEKAAQESQTRHALRELLDDIIDITQVPMEHRPKVQKALSDVYDHIPGKDPYTPYKGVGLSVGEINERLHGIPAPDEEKIRKSFVPTAPPDSGAPLKDLNELKNLAGLVKEELENEGGGEAGIRYAELRDELLRVYPESEKEIKEADKFLSYVISCSIITATFASTNMDHIISYSTD